MLRSIMAVGLVLATSLPGKAAETVGITTMAIDVPARDRALNVTLWYPAKAGGTVVRVGDSPVFEGVEGRQDAPIADGRLPIILVSHGGIRAAPGQGNWIGSGLAARGFVAAVVRGPRLGPSDAQSALQEIWQRPADLSATLSALETAPAWSGHLDHDRVGAVGFFLGGTSVLSQVGAKLDPDRFIKSCDAGGMGVDCTWFAASGVDLRSVDTERLALSNLDPRIKVAIAVDPELAASFSSESLSSVTVPVDIVNLGGLDAIQPGLRAAELASAIPGARYDAISHATPFSAFGLCKPQGLAILRKEGESDAICQDTGGQSREVTHAELTELIAERLAHPLRLIP